MQETLGFDFQQQQKGHFKNKMICWMWWVMLLSKSLQYEIIGNLSVYQ